LQSSQHAPVLDCSARHCPRRRMLCPWTLLPLPQSSSPCAGPP